MSDKDMSEDEMLIRLRHGSIVEQADLDARARREQDVAAKLADWDRQDAALHALYAPISDEAVPQRILDQLTRPRFGFEPVRRLAAAVLLIGIGATGGWFAALGFAPGPDADNLMIDAMRAHRTYVVETIHPVEVAASDSEHLTLWLSNRLGYRIALPNLTEYGFYLLGGRVVPNAEGTTAMMMYEDDIGRRITLSVLRTAEQQESELRYAGNDILRGFWWGEGELRCALVGDLPRDVLKTLSEAAYEGLTGAV